jgi:hypothetical protein
VLLHESNHVADMNALDSFAFDESVSLIVRPSKKIIRKGFCGEGILENDDSVVFLRDARSRRDARVETRGLGVLIKILP